MSTKTQQIKKEEEKKIVLSAIDKAEIEKSFAESKDFREVWEKITKPFDTIIEKTAQIIDNDPIMNVSEELKEMNGSVQGVYSDIIDNDMALTKFFKKVPILGWIIKAIDAKIDAATFDMKGIEWKIQIIFDGFDTTYKSVNKSIDLQVDFLDAIDKNLWKVEAYKVFIEEKLEEMGKRLEETTDEKQKQKLEMFIRNVEFFKTNLVVLIWNLDMARKRLLMRLDSANKLSLAMSSSRPIFKILLSTALIETSSQKAIDASMKAMNVMWETIDKMSSDLTDKAIDWNKKAEEMTSKPVLSTSVFIENVTKLKNYFEEMETYREEIKTQADEERKLFEWAKEKLENLKILNKKDVEELNAELVEK